MIEEKELILYDMIFCYVFEIAHSVVDDIVLKSNASLACNYCSLRYNFTGLLKKCLFSKQIGKQTHKKTKNKNPVGWTDSIDDFVCSANEYMRKYHLLCCISH